MKEGMSNHLRHRGSDGDSYYTIVDVREGVTLSVRTMFALDPSSKSIMVGLRLRAALDEDHIMNVANIEYYIKSLYPEIEFNVSRGTYLSTTILLKTKKIVGGVTRDVMHNRILAAALNASGVTISEEAWSVLLEEQQKEYEKCIPDAKELNNVIQLSLPMKGA